MNVCIFRQRDFYESCVLFLAKDDTNRGVFLVILNASIKVIDVHLHLAEILMC
jgi:hypothetical protein